MSDRKCAKKILGNAMKISKATPKQLRQIEKCSILASGGTPNPKVFGKSKKNIKKNTSKKTIRNLSEPLAPSKF
jgi:hypothetical protein|tara:strand:- start:929 stop:1150 length:222 start_codon:yes stop_codon:yes gene_type:complete